MKQGLKEVLGDYSCLEVKQEEEIKIEYETYLEVKQEKEIKIETEKYLDDQEVPVEDEASYLDIKYVEEVKIEYENCVEDNKQKEDVTIKNEYNDPANETCKQDINKDQNEKSDRPST